MKAVPIGERGGGQVIALDDALLINSHPMEGGAAGGFRPADGSPGLEGNFPCGSLTWGEKR
jgi:hypothetical protein